MQPTDVKIQVTASANMPKNKIIILCHLSMKVFAETEAEIIREDLEEILPEEKEGDTFF